MADKEPRRRKKKRDFPRKEDVQVDDLMHRIDTSRDSDGEGEEETMVAIPHEPGRYAQILFMLLFFSLAAVMCSVFIALHGTQSGHSSLFEDELSFESPELLLKDVSSHEILDAIDPGHQASNVDNTSEQSYVPDDLLEDEIHEEHDDEADAASEEDSEHGEEVESVDAFIGDLGSMFQRFFPSEVLPDEAVKDSYASEESETQEEENDSETEEVFTIEPSHTVAQSDEDEASDEVPDEINPFVESEEEIETVFHLGGTEAEVDTPLDAVELQDETPCDGEEEPTPSSPEEYVQEMPSIDANPIEDEPLDYYSFGKSDIENDMDEELLKTKLDEIERIAQNEDLNGDYEHEEEFDFWQF